MTVYKSGLVWGRLPRCLLIGWRLERKARRTNIWISGVGKVYPRVKIPHVRANWSFKVIRLKGPGQGANPSNRKTYPHPLLNIRTVGASHRNNVRFSGSP
jgi:hypothetical protein